MHYLVEVRQDQNWKVDLFNFFLETVIMIMIKIQGRCIHSLIITGEPTIPHQNNGTAPRYINYHLKRHFIAGYVQPIIQLYESTST